MDSIKSLTLQQSCDIRERHTKSINAKCIITNLNMQVIDFKALWSILLMDIAVKWSIYWSYS